MYDEALQERIAENTYSADRTAELLKRVQQNDSEALEEIVNENMPLVKSIVRGFMNRGTEYDDLVQLGSIGLIKAARNYNFEYGVRFSTYAVPLISGEIKRFLRDDGMIKVSRILKENYRKYANARERLSRELKREPTLNETAFAAGLTAEEAIEAIDSERPHVSVYEPLNDSGDSELALIDRLEDEEDTEENFSSRMLLNELLSTLDERERKIIALRYFEGLTQSEVARKLSMTQVQVSRCEKKILLGLRRQL